MNRLLIPVILIVEAACLLIAVSYFSYYSNNIAFPDYQTRQALLDTAINHGTILIDSQGHYYERTEESE